VNSLLDQYTKVVSKNFASKAAVFTFMNVFVAEVEAQRKLYIGVERYKKTKMVSMVDHGYVG